VAALNALSSARSWKPSVGHQELKLFARQLSIEVDDPEVYRVFREAEKLHAGFYHAFLTVEDSWTSFQRLRMLLGRSSRLSEYDPVLGTTWFTEGF
jgi:hypothetical protein